MRSFPPTFPRFSSRVPPGSTPNEPESDFSGDFPAESTGEFPGDFTGEFSSDGLVSLSDELRPDHSASPSRSDPKASLPPLPPLNHDTGRLPSGLAFLASLQARSAQAVGELVLESTGDLSRSSALIALLDFALPDLLEVAVIFVGGETLCLRTEPSLPAPDPSRQDSFVPGQRAGGSFRHWQPIPGRNAWLMLGKEAPFQRRELRAATEVAAAIATALELRNALFQRARILREDFDRLVEVTQEISRCQRLSELYETITREGQKLLAHRRHTLICLQRYSASFEELTCVALTGEDTERLRGLKLCTDVNRTRIRFYPRYEDERIATDLPRQRTLSFTGALIKANLDYMLIPDVELLSKGDPYYSLSPKTRSEIAVPIVLADGTRWGVFNVENPEPNAFSEFFDLPLLQGFARIIAVFIKALELRDQSVTLDDLDAIPEELRRAIRLFAQSEESVLVTGETGTGKELVARALHDGSQRRRARFVPVNCGAIEPNLMMSELFGTAAHAFTGSGTKDRPGLFHTASGGTIFLDEIENMPMAVQEAVLRVVERGEVRKVGDTRVEEVDVRIVAATNVSLDKKIQDGAFRQDLYYRLKILEITLPPLRERKEFISRLVQDFVGQYRRPTQTVSVSPDLLQVLERYHWPGNVRELKNAIKRMLVFSSHLTVDLLPEEIRRAAVAVPSASKQPPAIGTSQAEQAPGAGPGSVTKPEPSGPGAPAAGLEGQAATGPLSSTGENGQGAASSAALVLHMQFNRTENNALEQAERQLLQQALNAFNGDRYQVAHFLGISPPSVYRKIKSLGLSEERRWR